ncbi:hypothetical protein G5C51_35905 [Streptomyces sp. A7024]|uniref:Uncharacterized protein n=2 Tax=Streptomyces coryli TaxID=1128680 RepID=A0A6G4UAK2_9ACTN|nr:hypothetical protein [Streptomyces coryli]
MVNPAHWPVIPRRVRAGGRALHIGWCIDQDPNKLLLRSYSVGCWDLLVIPPETAPGTAAGLLRDAAEPGNRLTASDLLAKVGRLPSAAVGRAA